MFHVVYFLLRLILLSFLSCRKLTSARGYMMYVGALDAKGYFVSLRQGEASCRSQREYVVEKCTAFGIVVHNNGNTPHLQQQNRCY